VALGGFPWSPAAHAWIAVPGALPLSAWIGGWGVSFLVVLANAGVVFLARRRWIVGSLALVVPVAALAAAALVPAAAPRWSGEPVEVRVLQPNIPNLVVADRAAVRANFEKVLTMATRACDREGALLVWPESAAWPYTLERDAALRARVDALVALGCPVLLNSARYEGEAVFNAAYLVGGAGPGSIASADKRHLVPYGEYVPLRGVVPLVGTLARNAGEFTPARELRLLEWGGERLGLAICFEVIFAGETAALVQHGATLLATLTNDAWYGDTAAPWQHLRAAQFRAAELRRPLLRAAITGVSAIIEPDGSLRSSLGPGEEGVLAGTVRGRTDRSPYSRAPWTPVWASLAIVAAILLVAKEAR
jgi:apolipoprotein N-acyltransferase